MILKPEMYDTQRNIEILKYFSFKATAFPLILKPEIAFIEKI